MTYATRLRLESGDRDALDGVVEAVTDAAARKGAEFKGPHTPPPERYRVSLYGTTAADSSLETWDYTVYRRELTIVGRDDLARDLATRNVPDSVRVEVEVEQIRSTGR